MARWIGVSYFEFQKLPSGTKRTARNYFSALRSEIIQGYSGNITGDTDGMAASYYVMRAAFQMFFLI